MQKEYLPEKVSPYRMSEHGTSLDGIYLFKNMGRLNPSLAEIEGEVDVHLIFGTIEKQRTPFVKGRLSAWVKLQCQRCLCPFDYEIISDWLWGVVASEAEEVSLPKRYDPIYVDENGMLLLQDMIEDELIVNLPIVAMHDPEDCKAKLPLKAHDSEVEKEIRENPFKVIEFLHTKPK